MSPVARPMSPSARPMSPTEGGEWLPNELQFDFRAISPEEMVNSGLYFADFGPDITELGQFQLTPRPRSPPPNLPYGRFGKADSGEWHVYGNSSATGRMSKSVSDEQLMSPPGSLSPEGGRFASTGEFYRSLSPTKAEDLRQRNLSLPTMGRLAAAAKKEWLVYKSEKDGEKLRKRALSPPEVQKKQFFTRGDGKKSAHRSVISTLGKLVKGGKRGKEAEGGRVISSSDGPIKSPDSAGPKKERLSVCKMAAMNMAKERGHEKKSKDSASPSSVQHWLSKSEPRPDQSSRP